jgi:hypothetical protein
VVGNLMFNKAPTYGLVLNAAVRSPNIVTNVNDHDAWTLYGLIEGNKTYIATSAPTANRATRVLPP